ncbi:hypothetical protein ACVIQY_004748 [Bradyrhizobium sp. USDA 3051]
MRTRTHPRLAVTTAITDSSSTVVISCSEATGWVRHAVILSASDRWASKNFGSSTVLNKCGKLTASSAWASEAMASKMATPIADQVVIADQLEQEGGGGEGREALQRRGQREA